MISKLPQVGTSIFSKMTGLANQHQAINLSQGFPGFDPDPLVIEKISRHLQEGKNQYAPALGIPELRQALSLKYGYHADDEITVTAGASEALYSAITATVNPGDEVILIEPSYDLYLPAVLLQGGIPKFVKMSFPDYRIDWDEVKDLINSRTRLIILNTPHNPTGKVFELDDIAALQTIVAAHPQVYLISDEVYEHILFDGRKHLSLGDYPDLRERAFVCNSFAKTYHITGWKTGYCLAPKKLSIEFRKIHQYITFCTFTAAQYALAEYMQETDSHTTLSQFYQGKRDLFLSHLDQNHFTVLPSEGTFFQNLSYHGISAVSDVLAAERLTVDAGIASIPVSVFYADQTDHQVLRFCLAKDDDILVEAVERLNKAKGIL
jgi:methionine aminotransferase